MKAILISMLVLTIAANSGANGLSTLVYPPFRHSWGIHKGTETKLDMLLDNATDFDNTQGLAAVRHSAWDDPDSEKDDDELTAYGVNSGRDQIIYNSSMYTLAIYGESGPGEGRFDAPRGIAADPSGDIFVCDTGNRRIVHLFNDGKGLAWIGSFGEDILVEPHGVAVTESGTLFVTDRSRDVIEAFDYAGGHIKTLEGLLKPTGIAVDNPMVTKTRYGERAIFVVDGDGTQVRKMTYDGMLLATSRIADITAPSGRLGYIALDFYDNAWITDSVTCRIHKFDNRLEYIASIGECGKKDYQFDHPTGIAIWRRFGQIVIAEARSAQYLWVGSDITDIKTLKAKNRKGEPALEIDFFLTDRSYVTFVLKRDKKIVRELYNHRRLKQGKRKIYWDYKDDSGIEVEPGDYSIEILIEPTYSSYGYFDKTVSIPIKIDG